jgi:hypothetical protein
VDPYVTPTMYGEFVEYSGRFERGKCFVYGNSPQLSTLASCTFFMRLRTNQPDLDYVCHWGGPLLTTGSMRFLKAREGILGLYGGGDDPPIGTTVVSDGAWHSIACTIDATDNYKTTLYVDGVPESQTATQLNPEIVVDPTSVYYPWSVGALGSRDDIPTAGCTFDANDVAVWDTPLDAAAIANLHSGAVGFATYETLLLHVPLDGDTVDQSAFAHEPTYSTVTFASHA